MSSTSQDIGKIEESSANADISDAVQKIWVNSERFIVAEAAEKLISNFASGYHLAYSVNMKDDSYKILQMDESILICDRDFEDFTEIRDFFLAEIIHPADTEMMRYELDYSTIRQKLSDTKLYSVEYRTLVRGETSWNEMIVSLISGDDIAVSFSIRDLEITKRRLEEERFNDYLALFVVDLDTEMIKTLKSSQIFKTGLNGEAKSYVQSISEFLKSYNGEAKEFFTRAADMDNIRQDFSVDNKRTFSYKSYIFGESRWIDVTGYVIHRHEDGTPAMTTIGFSLSDTLASERQEIQAKLKEDMHLIGGLASGYKTLYYVNIDEGTFTIHTLDGEKYPETKELVSKGGDPFTTLQSFGRSEMVHPDDRRIFESFTAESFRERLSHSKKFSVRYRRLSGDDYLWNEMDVIKYENVNEQANAIAIGFADVDYEIRSEQALNSCLDILGQNLTPQESIDKLLSTAGEYYGSERCYIFEYAQNNAIINNTYEWCEDGIQAMITQLQGVPAKEITGWIREFRARGAFYMDALDDEDGYNTPEGRELLEMQGITSLVACPLMAGDEIVGFIGLDNPKKAKTNIAVLKNVAVVAYNEILQRKQTQMAMLESAKIFSDTFLGSYVSTYYVNLTDGSHIVYNRSAYIEANYGNIDNFFESVNKYIQECVYQDDREMMKEAVKPEKIRENLKNADNYSLRMRDISEGRLLWYRLDITKGSDSDHVGIAFSDITDQVNREKEQAVADDLANQQRHIRAFGDMVNAALWSVDIDEDNEVTAVFWSDEFRHMFGFDNTEDFPNTIDAWISRLHPEDREKTLKYFYISMESRTTEDFLYDDEYRVLRKNNEYCWYHAVGRMETIDGNGRRIYGIIFDVSADKKLEQQQKQLEEARWAAEEANRSKTSFLFNMSHDIRTPMNAITGFTNMAKKYAGDSERVADYLDKIDTSGQQLLTLVNQVLEMSRIESGKVELEEKPMDVTAEFNSMVTVLTEQALTNGLSFLFAMRNVTHERVLADKARLSSIALNITGNAMKYTPKGGRIDLTLTEIESRKKGCASFVLTVADTGIGMSEDYQKVLFDPFTREKNSTVSKIQGTGLGMSIVKNLVDLMEGNIEVKSEVGKGTRFDITLDFRIDDEYRNEAETEKQCGNISFEGLRVLLVEDNELNREIAIDMLRDEGFSTEEADDGTRAVELMKEKGPDYYDLILMDIQMPVMGGYEATEAIRSMYPDKHIPIIALSANAFSEDREKSLNAGMDDHVAKPVKAEDLFSVLAQYVPLEHTRKR